MIEKTWYLRNKNIIAKSLIPISKIFTNIALRRQKKYSQNQYKSKIPIIIVGNISVGGTGKTPVVLNLCNFLLKNNKKVAIISRGYQAKSKYYPFEINNDTKPNQCGDEPYMMFEALNKKVPIIIDPNRTNAIKYIENNLNGIDFIISDDGLQHYKIGRSYEIVVIDALRMFGNGLCIPAGPLREPVNRIKTVDSVIAIGDINYKDKQILQNLNKNTQFTKIEPISIVNIVTNERINIENFNNKSVVAVAGIGNPNKFFKSLDEININIVVKKIFKDHHKFQKSDFNDINKNNIVIMTYKDAVKCRSFVNKNFWYLDIGLDLNFNHVLNL